MTNETIYPETTDTKGETRRDFIILTASALGAIGAAAQDGMVFNFGKLTPDLSRLNPISYFGRIFSSTGLVELLQSAIKIIVIIFVAWKTARWGAFRRMIWGSRRWSASSADGWKTCTSRSRSPATP